MKCYAHANKHILPLRAYIKSKEKIFNTEYILQLSLPIAYYMYTCHFPFQRY